MLPYRPRRLPRILYPCSGYYMTAGVRCAEFDRKTGMCKSCHYFYLQQKREQHILTTPEEALDDASKKLRLSKKVNKFAKKLLKEIVDNDPKDICKNPHTVAGGLLYMSALIHKETRTQKEVANACYLTETTIRGENKRLFLLLKTISHQKSFKKNTSELGKRISSTHHFATKSFCGLPSPLAQYSGLR